MERRSMASNSSAMAHQKRKLTLQQKIFVLGNFYENARSWALVRNAFQQKYELQVPEANIGFEEIVASFERTGSVRQTIFCVFIDNTEETKIEPVEPGYLDSGHATESIHPIVGGVSTEITPSLEALSEWKASSSTDDEDGGSIYSPSDDGSRKQGGHRRNKYCRICEKQFRTPECLRTHRKNVHAVSCTVCNKTFLSEHSLKAHEIQHLPAEQQKALPCHYCGKTFAAYKYLRRHLESCHIDEVEGTAHYVCEWCGKKFIMKHRYTVHVYKHTRPFQCKLCSANFSSNSTRASHVRRYHTGERPYKCDYCDKSFIDSLSCKIHHRQHTGENPFICHLCNKTTKTHQNLKSHFRHAHKIENPKLEEYNKVRKKREDNKNLVKNELPSF